MVSYHSQNNGRTRGQSGRKNTQSGAIVLHTNLSLTEHTILSIFVFFDFQ